VPTEVLAQHNGLTHLRWGMVPRDAEIDEAVAGIGAYAASADWAS